MDIEWERIGQEDFDRMVETLVQRLYQDSSTVEVIDGRGGDGGRDIVVRQGSRIRIFQLNTFRKASRAVSRIVEVHPGGGLITNQVDPRIEA